MSSVDPVTALSAYEAQVSQAQSQNTTLNQTISTLQSQISSLSSQLQPLYNGLNSLYNAYNPVPDNATDPYSVQIRQINGQLSPLQTQLSSAQSQLSTNNSTISTLQPIIDKLKGNITQYYTPTAMSTSNPSTTSDTAHNIATTLSGAVTSAESFLSSVPKTDLYIGLGVLVLLFVLK